MWDVVVLVLVVGVEELVLAVGVEALVLVWWVAVAWVVEAEE